jgi:hypothetical protein
MVLELAFLLNFQSTVSMVKGLDDESDTVLVLVSASKMVASWNSKAAELLKCFVVGLKGMMMEEMKAGKSVLCLT